MKYAIQNKRTGATIEYCNNATEAIAQYFLSNEEFELVETANKSVIKVYYCEPACKNIMVIQKSLLLLMVVLKDASAILLNGCKKQLDYLVQMLETSMISSNTVI